MRHNPVLGGEHGMADLLSRVPQWPTGMKSVEFLEVFRSLEVSKHRSECAHQHRSRCFINKIKILKIKNAPTLVRLNIKDINLAPKLFDLGILQLHRNVPVELLWSRILA